MKKLLSAVLVSALALGFSLSAASCSDSKDYSSELASLQQQMKELQDKNQDLENQMNSVSSENDALKSQIAKLISSNQIPSYTLGDNIPCIIDGIKIFELKNIEFPSDFLRLATSDFFTTLPFEFFQKSFSGLIFDYATNQTSYSSAVTSNPIGINFHQDSDIFPLEGKKTVILFFYGTAFANITFRPNKN